MSHNMNNNNQQFDFLDGLSIISFLTQMQNIQSDEEYIHYIKKVIYLLVEEIKKLHQENDNIMAKLDLVIEELKSLKGAYNE